MSNFPWGSAICLKSFGFLIPQPSIGGLCPELVLHWWREGPGGSQLCGPSCTTPLHQIPPPQIPSRLLFHTNNQAAWNSFEQVISPAKPLCSRLISKWSTSGNFLGDTTTFKYGFPVLGEQSCSSTFHTKSRETSIC